MVELPSDDEAGAQLGSDWGRDGNEVIRVCEFDGYLDGVIFAASVGEIAGEELHHPEITIRYQEVKVRFMSHGEGGITDKDLQPVGLFDDGL